MTVTEQPSATSPRSASFLRSLRKFHAWIGLSGAAFGLLFGLTGILQNHRSVMKIELGQVEEKKVQIELANPPASLEALAQALTAQLGWSPDRIRTRVQPARPAKFQGAEVKATEQWMVAYSGAKHFARAMYIPGNKTVEVEQRDANLWEALSRLHKADAGQKGWILFSDALAGGLLFMSLSGILLWTRLSGSRLMAVGMSLAVLIVGVFFASRGW
jgi:hypothetical protein